MKQFFTFLFLLSSLTAFAQAPANDDCAGAIELIPDDGNANTYLVTSDMIAGATNTGDILIFQTQNGNQIVGHSEDDIWFTFEATSNFININLTNNGRAMLYKGDCNNLEFLHAGNIYTDLQVGERYYIKTYDFSRLSALLGTSYTITLTTEDPCYDNNIAPFVISLDYDPSTERYTLLASGGLSPYTIYDVLSDYGENFPYDEDNGWSFSLWDNTDGFLFSIIDDNNCTRYFNKPGMIYTNINKLALFDYKMSVFPNPANYASKLSLSVEKATEMQIQITNIAGQILYSEVVFVEGDMAFDLKISDLPNGVYMVSAISENSIQTKELLISK